MNDQEYTLELRCRYEEWWRYNAALMCGCFDAADRRTGFVSTASEVADVGSNLPAAPANAGNRRRLALTIPACDHFVAYVYIIPHTLPTGNDIETTQPFEVELRVTRGAETLLQERRRVNQWSGASIELKIGSGE